MKRKTKREEEEVDEEQVKGKKEKAGSQKEDRQKRGFEREDNVTVTRRHSWKLAIPETSAAAVERLEEKKKLSKILTKKTKRLESAEH